MSTNKKAPRRARPIGREEVGGLALSKNLYKRRRGRLYGTALTLIAGRGEEIVPSVNCKFLPVSIIHCFMLGNVAFL